jgi:TonB family protein
MRFAILSSLALLPVLAQAQAAPAGSQTLASVSQPKLVRASANPVPAATVNPAGVAVAPASLRDVIAVRLNSDLRDQRAAGEIVYTFYGDSQANDARVQVPQLIHTVGRSLPVSKLPDAEKTDVAVHVIVDAAGVPLFSSIAHSNGQPAIDSATLAAVHEYRFAPAKIDGIPVESDVTLTIHLEKN